MREWKMAAAGSVALALALALVACAPRQDVASANAPRSDAAPLPTMLPAGAPRPTGASLGGMSEQYAHPRPGPVAAVGAHAWVVPGPPPAFEISTPLPPPDPPAPRPAAVANRQPSASQPAPAAPASPVVRPGAAASAPAAPAASVDLAKGRQLFSQYACGGCHILADGGGSGGIGPALDNNSRLTRDFVIGAVSEGRGAMPAFRDQMTAEEIATLADYIVQVARK